ncbi:MAG TPA: hypothetical protein VL404_06280 [Candidatus Eisenbacteria bacterium]|jgi:hypothetical protein|nr:hypothetical protein [Candidatus Eisenbacteria bacterium]
MQKTKAIQHIEERMQGLEPESLRYRILDSAKDFKSSWIELGRYLFTVYKDKTFKDWGYLTFEAYCAKEIGIRQATAVKMLKSYSFLEREEPSFVREDAWEEKKPREIPGYESVNALRLAKESESITERQYKDLREEVFEGGKEDAEVKKKIRYVLKNARPAQAKDPVEEKGEALTRLHSQLRQAKLRLNELEIPAKILKHLDALIEVLDDFAK